MWRTRTACLNSLSFLVAVLVAFSKKAEAETVHHGVQTLSFDGSYLSSVVAWEERSRTDSFLFMGKDSVYWKGDRIVKRVGLNALNYVSLPYDTETSTRLFGILSDGSIVVVRGLHKAYLDKFDPRGNLKWSFRIRQPGLYDANEYVRQLVVDPVDNSILVTGIIDVAWCGNGGNADAFVYRIDSDEGTLIWSTFLGLGTGHGCQVDDAWGIAVDPVDRSVIICGISQRDVRTPSDIPKASYITRLSSNGKVKWSRTLKYDDGYPVWISKVAVNPRDQSIVFVGSNDGSLRVYGVLGRYSAEGVLIELSMFGYRNSLRFWNVAIDLSGSIYILGSGQQYNGKTQVVLRMDCTRNMTSCFGNRPTWGMFSYNSNNEKFGSDFLLDQANRKLLVLGYNNHALSSMKRISVDRIEVNQIISRNSDSSTSVIETSVSTVTASSSTSFRGKQSPATSTNGEKRGSGFLPWIIGVSVIILAVAVVGLGKYILAKNQEVVQVIPEVNEADNHEQLNVNEIMFSPTSGPSLMPASNESDSVPNVNAFSSQSEPSLKPSIESGSAPVNECSSQSGPSLNAAQNEGLPTYVADVVKSRPAAAYHNPTFSTSDGEADDVHPSEKIFNPWISSLWLHNAFEGGASTAFARMGSLENGLFLVEKLPDPGNYIINVNINGEHTRHIVSPDCEGVLLVNNMRLGNSTSIEDLVDKLSSESPLYKNWPVQLVRPVLVSSLPNSLPNSNQCDLPPPYASIMNQEGESKA
eukprot:m.33874 g.33874  ORF g.33874 m.33874 type:complete len:752 (-) comp8621_c0_seq1:141-2396(-)